MKISIIALSFLLLASIVYSQDQPTQTQTQPAQVQPLQPQTPQKAMPNHITSGFYLKLGGSFPMGNFTNNQKFTYTDNTNTQRSLTFNHGKFGGVLEMGFLIYLGPAFAHNHLRAGLDATFFTASFNPADSVVPSGTSASKKMEYWYYFGGQKFGPLLTISPIDYLMIDLSYKINATAAWHASMWGMNLAMNEVSLGIRYRVMLFAFQYNWGKVEYTYNQEPNPKEKVSVDTFRVLIGFKF
jgi:hypothetical protein